MLNRWKLTRESPIYIHAYIHIREPSSISILLFNSKGERVFEEIFLNILSLSLSSRIFFLLFGGRRREGKKLRSSKNPPFVVSANTMYLIPFIPRANTRGKRIRGVGPRTYFTHHGRSASVPAKGGFILSRFTMLYGVGLAASTNNCQLNVPSIDLVPRISFLSC